MKESHEIIFYNSREELTVKGNYQCLIKTPNADLVAWVKRHCISKRVILINAEVNLPDYWEQRLLAPLSDKSVSAVTALTTRDYNLSPLPAEFDFPGSAKELDALLSVLAPAKTFLSNTFNPDILLLTDIDQLLSLDEVHVTTNLLVQADKVPLRTLAINIGDQHPLPAHPMSAVQWLISQQKTDYTIKLDYPLLNDKPNLLHIVMDWGGGIHRWMHDYISIDSRYNHFVLVSEGEFYRKRYGEKFSLYYDGYEGVLLAQFELTPSIEAVAINHELYNKMLNNLIGNYDIGGIMVSSLIGHSMDCLTTGLPTVRVLHDYFPHWPGLDARLDIDTITEDTLQQSLLASDGTPFGDVNPDQVKDWQRALNKKLSDDKVQVVAPDQSVIENLLKLPHSSCYQKATVIPHGVTALKAIDYQADKEPFTVLVLGRLIVGKGKHLLQQVMAQESLADVHWLLLGSGDDGDNFKNLRQVKVIKNYQRSQLTQLLNKHSPQLALMPAGVSESFSYVLSELQMLAIPALATRVGALKNRIKNNVTGFLVDGDCQVITEQLLSLIKASDKRKKVHKNLLSQSFKSLKQMDADYQKLWSAFKVIHPNYTYTGLIPIDIKAERLLRLNRHFDKLSKYNIELQDNLAEKTQWAKRLDKQILLLESDLKDRTKWIKTLEIDLKKRTRWAKKIENNLEQRTTWAKQLEADLEKRTLWAEKLDSQVENLENEIKEKTKWAKKLDQHVAHLTHNLKLARGDNEALHKQLKTSQKVHEQSIQALFIQIDNLSDTLSELTGRLKQTKSELNQAQEINNQQQRQQQIIVQERDQARDLINQIMRSRSWRLTRPLRGMVRITRRFKNKFVYRLKQLTGLPKRIINSIKTRGVKASWQLAKQKLSHKQKKVSEKAKILATKYQSLQLNTANKPVVSIIIPVYNHFQHSYHCLKSIGEIDDKTDFEVIVVDDCSTDETHDLMTLISGIRYHRQAQNGGFIRSCNQGAQLAKGAYLLFLNNDTEVKNGWLDALVNTFESHPEVGLVGSQLRYPDGRLQEAGGIVFSDASGWNYGRLESPDQPEVNHVRAVSYCSGASIMVPSELFKKLGYFDTRYVPAYYEDTDLAFAVREAGLRVLYQPDSQVIHFEGISSGTDVNTGVKKYQVVNQQKFADKWQQALKNQPVPGTPIEQARFQEHKKRILIVDACTPTPDQDSGSLRMLNIIQILQELDFHVSFMPENMAYFGEYTQQLQQRGVECVYAPTYSSPVDYLAKKGHLFSVIILSRYYVAQPLLKSLSDYAAKAQLWFDTVDLHYLRELRMAELSADKSALKPAKQTKIKELAVAKACHLTLVVSPYEQSVLAKETPELEVSVLSNIHEVYGSQKDYSKRRDLVFIGGYQHTPNVDGICWFVTEIWPLIRTEIADIKLHIVGSKAPDKVRQLGEHEGVIFHGFVKDIEPVMTDYRIAVAPLRFGAGVKGKVNMSMSYGQPVVGTTVAVEGMYTQHGEDVLMADEANDFARQVIRLYQDKVLWQRLSAGGLRNVEQYFSFGAAKKIMADLLEEATKNR